MKIFIDNPGHLDLLQSMHYLFEKHLDWELFSPILDDSEWHSLLQLLPPVEFGTIEIHKDGVQIVDQGSFRNYKQTRISFQKFKEIPFDFIMTICWENEPKLFNLRNQYHQNAKFLRHIANIHEQPVQAKNILLSVLTPMSANTCKYLPEHHTAFTYSEKYTLRSIKSFYSAFAGYPDEVRDFKVIQNALTDFSFYPTSYPEDKYPSFKGFELPNAMKDAQFIYHPKGLGCCGYVARQALSCGKPLLVKKKYANQHNTFAKEYLIDGFNCIDIDSTVRPMNETLKLIRQWSEPAFYESKSKEIANWSKTYFDFNREALKIKEWMENLK